MTISDNPLHLMVRKFETHASLSAADRDALLALPHVRRTVDPATYLIREADAPTHCAVLISGYAYRQKLTGEGARQIVSIHIPGEALDLQHLYFDVADHNVQTRTRAEVALIPRAALRDLAMERPGVNHAIFLSTLVEASIFREWVLNVGRRDSRARVAHLLCEFAIRIDAQGLADPKGYVLPMTQEQLGDAIGLTAVHVNRTLKSLTLDGLISRDNRRVSFPDWEALRHAADFSERYLHLNQQRA